MSNVNNKASSGFLLTLFKRFFIIFTVLTLVSSLSNIYLGSAWSKNIVKYKYTAGMYNDGDLTYEQAPPAGGPHNSVAQNCGIYALPLLDETVVNSLERGAVWITYKPDKVSYIDIVVLARQYQRNKFVIVSPYPTQSSPIILSAWNAQLSVNSSSDFRINKFVDFYANSPDAPQPDASCTEGIDSSIYQLLTPPEPDV
jgi:hypothetical protein